MGRGEKYKSMTPTTKESQRTELHKTIWRIANDLRGSVDGWDFKSYVLGMLFYRFISENLAAYINKGEHEAGEADFNYARLPDAQAEFGRKETVSEKGFYVLPSELFENVRRRAATDPNLNETLERVFKNIEGSAVGTDSEDDLKGLFDDLDVNSSKLGNTVAKRNEKLVKLLDAIGDLPLGNFEDNSIDLFGDAYEYLMQMYASQAGKSGGEYYTPQEVSEVLARITVIGKERVNKVYDPAAGSGSLLLKFAKVLGRENVGGFFGQEINLTTYNLARINMFLHDLNYEKFNIAHGDTLTDPQHWDDEPFEAIVSNPPYSIKWEGDANPLLINDERFAPAGVLAPKSKADLAFTMHILSWLAVNGTAAIRTALWALGVGRNKTDEVICPSFTWWPTVTPVTGLGAQVVFAEIDPTTLTLDPLQDDALLVVAEGWEEQGAVERAIQWYERFLERLDATEIDRRRALKSYLDALRRQ